MKTENFINKEKLIQYLKTLSKYKDKNIIDVQFIERVNELWKFTLMYKDYENNIVTISSETIKNDDYDQYRLNKWYNKNWKGF
jgi:hypothetical protein